MIFKITKADINKLKFNQQNYDLYDRAFEDFVLLNNDYYNTKSNHKDHIIYK